MGFQCCHSRCREGASQHNQIWEIMCVHLFSEYWFLLLWEAVVIEENEVLIRLVLQDFFYLFFFAYVIFLCPTLLL